MENSFFQIKEHILSNVGKKVHDIRTNKYVTMCYLPPGWKSHNFTLIIFQPIGQIYTWFVLFISLMVTWKID